MSYLINAMNPAKVPQSEPLNDSQKANNGGGYSFTIPSMDQFRRFLILGSEGGSYYATERKLTNDNIKVIDQVLTEAPFKAIEVLVEVSDKGLAPKNDQAIFALAKATCHTSLDVRKAAWAALPKVCRIGTHLYQFAEFRKILKGGWGRLAKDSIGKWFLDRSAESLALQVAKYKQREGWSARDLLRLSHPKTWDSAKNAVFRWVAAQGNHSQHDLPKFLQACNEVQKATPKEAVKLITEFKLPREVLPTELLNSAEVWEALIQHMGAIALIRNLGKISSIGLTNPLSSTSIEICQKLSTDDFIKSSRIHPVNILNAYKVYGQGAGVKGSLKWEANRSILSAIEVAFYNSFKFVEPTGKRILIALDVSGSMSFKTDSVLTACEVASAMAMTTLRTEPYNAIVRGFAGDFRDLGISSTDSLDKVTKKAYDHNFGNTDCSLPMLWAERNKVPVDAFVVYTDNETNYGSVHPSVALEIYRQKMGIDSKLIVCGVTATEFSIANPLDKGSLDVVGFDSSAPQLISEFMKGSF